jgi:hypothetical protein
MAPTGLLSLRGRVKVREQMLILAPMGFGESLARTAQG